MLELAQEHDLLILIAIGLEDVRHHHRLVIVPDVAAGDIAQTVNAFPQVRFLVTGGRFREVTSIWQGVDKRDNLYVENSRVQGPIHDVAKLCKTIGPDHVLFGSNSPLHYHESAKLSIETEITDTGRVHSAVIQSRMRCVCFVTRPLRADARGNWLKR